MTAARWVAWAWLVSRLALIGMALVIIIRADYSTSFLQVVSHWDVQHFLGIARDGYQTTGEDAQRMAFFPGWPLLLAPFMALGLPGAAVGLVISAVASAFAAAALYRLGGRRVGPWAAALWLISPAAVFGFVPYTEALFCALAFWAWFFAKNDRWAIAAVLAAGACAVRVSGVFLVVALGVLILTRPMPAGTALGKRLAAWLRRGLWLLLPVAAVGAYLGYLFWLTGSWTAWSDAQQAGWSRAWAGPTDSILRTIDVIASPMYDDRPGWDTVFTFELVSFAVGLLAVGWLWRRRQWAELVWIAAQLAAFSSSEWLMSVNRAVLLWFPVWLIAGELASKRVRAPGARIVQWIGRIGWIVVSVGVMLWWSQMFYRSEWSS
ncbi:MAG: mannosyltransferase family protein [Propionibacteriaceae bacterium]|nr:mannosyltransferase family protein [Propionibacteriaceae bacterium]